MLEEFVDLEEERFVTLDVMIQKKVQMAKVFIKRSTKKP